MPGNRGSQVAAKRNCKKGTRERRSCKAQPSERKCGCRVRQGECGRVDRLSLVLWQGRATIKARLQRKGQPCSVAGMKVVACALGPAGRLNVQDIVMADNR
jgi:hypothetical protein